jgi:hypothetical protein
MIRNAYRDKDDKDQPDSYWRRRVIMLAAGLGLLGLLAWAFSGGGGKPTSPAPGNSQASGILPAAAYSGAPTAPATGVNGSGSAPASGMPSPSATSTSATKGSAKAGTSPSPSGGAGATSSAPAVTATKGGGCSPSAMVLSLFTSKPEYSGGQYPQFDVYAVSTAPRACSFGIGSRQLHVVVMSAGRIIWDSADCASGEPKRTAELSRGVPAQESVAWNRAISLPGCVKLTSSARPGTYQVEAKTATVASPVHTFKLVPLLLTTA